MRHLKHGSHLWWLENAESLGVDPYEGLSAEEREEHLRWDTRQWIGRKLRRIARSEPSALYLDEIPQRRREMHELVGPGETLEMYWPGDANDWVVSQLDGPSRTTHALRRRLDADGEARKRSAEQAAAKAARDAERKAQAAQVAARMTARSDEDVLRTIEQWVASPDNALSKVLETTRQKLLTLHGRVPLGVDPQPKDQWATAFRQTLLLEPKSGHTMHVSDSVLAELTGGATPTKAGARVVSALLTARLGALDAAVQNARERMERRVARILAGDDT